MPNQQSHDYSGANPMGDTLAFVKQLWSGMKIPGMSIPSLSPEDIDKQIADLKAVESWLQVNMNMLRSSIQALEVQSATLTALRSMGESFAKAAAGAGVGAGAGAGATAPQMALLVVDNQFAMATRGALKMLAELGSAVTEVARSIIFLFGADAPVQSLLKASNSACGF